MKEKNLQVVEPEVVRDILINAKKKYGEEIACLEKKKITYNQMYGDVTALGMYIYEILDIHNSVIGIFSENSYYADVAIYANIFGDNIVYNMDEEMDAKKLDETIKKSGAKLLFFTKDKKEIVEELKKVSKINCIILEDYDENFETIKECITSGIDILRSGRNSYMYIREKKEDKKICISSDKKVLYMKSDNIISYIKNIKEKLMIREKSRFLSVLHLSNTSELIISRLLNMEAGATIIYLKEKDIVSKISENNINVALVQKEDFENIYNKIYTYIQKNKDIEKINKLIYALNKFGKYALGFKRMIFRDILKEVGTSLEKLIVVGESLDNEQIKFLNDIGIIVITAYSSKSTIPLISIASVNNLETDNVGYPIADIDLKLKDKNEDGIGEILVKGNLTQNEYISTGDVGYIDNLGKVHLVGKIKNVITLEDGNKIYPEFLKLKLKRIDNVKDASIQLRKIDGKDELFANIILKEKYCIRNNDEKQLMIYNSKFSKKQSKRERKQDKKMLTPLEKLIKRDNRKYILERLEEINKELKECSKIKDFKIIECDN